MTPHIIFIFLAVYNKRPSYRSETRLAESDMTFAPHVDCMCVNGAKLIMLTKIILDVMNVCNVCYFVPKIAFANVYYLLNVVKNSKRC